MRGLVIPGCVALLLLTAVPAAAGGNLADAVPGGDAPRAVGFLTCPDEVFDCFDCQPKLLPIETIFESLENCVLNTNAP